MPVAVAPNVVTWTVRRTSPVFAVRIRRLGRVRFNGTWVGPVWRAVRVLCNVLLVVYRVVAMRPTLSPVVATLSVFGGGARRVSRLVLAWVSI